MIFFYILLFVWFLLGLFSYIFYNQDDNLLFHLFVSQSEGWGFFKLSLSIIIIVITVIIIPLYEYDDSTYNFVTKEKVSFTISMDKQTITDSKDIEYDIIGDSIKINNRFVCKIKDCGSGVYMLTNGSNIFVSGTSKIAYGEIKESLEVIMTRKPVMVFYKINIKNKIDKGFLQLDSINNIKTKKVDDLNKLTELYAFTLYK